MPVQFKQGYARIVAARQKLVEVRAARWETLQRFKTFAKAKLPDFVGFADPVTGQRLVDISAGGDKARGEAAMVLGFFEGTKLRLVVDASGQYGFEVNPPELLSDVARIVDIIVPQDASSAEMIYESVTGPQGLHRLDFGAVLLAMVQNVATVVEEELGDAGRMVPFAAAAAPTPAPKPVFSFSIG